MLAAGEEVRRRQALLGQAGAVGAAADDAPHRLDARTPDRLLGRVDDLRVPVEDVAHVAVLPLDGERVRGSRLAADDLRDDAAHALDVLLELRVVVVAGDHPERRLRRGTGHPLGVHEALAPVGRLGREPRGSAAITSAMSLSALTSRPFADPGWTPTPSIVSSSW